MCDEGSSVLCKDSRDLTMCGSRALLRTPCGVAGAACSPGRCLEEGVRCPCAALQVQQKPQAGRQQITGDADEGATRKTADARETQPETHCTHLQLL